MKTEALCLNGIYWCYIVGARWSKDNALGLYWMRDSVRFQQRSIFIILVSWHSSGPIRVPGSLGSEIRRLSDCQPKILSATRNHLWTY
jgi:hypothetical protein